MKLKPNFIIHDTGTEQVMVATGANAFPGLVRSNKTAAFLVEQLKTETTPAQIVDAVCARYDAPRTVVERDVAAILEQLWGIGAIEE